MLRHFILSVLIQGYEATCKKDKECTWFVVRGGPDHYGYGFSCYGPAHYPLRRNIYLHFPHKRLFPRDQIHLRYSLHTNDYISKVISELVNE